MYETLLSPIAIGAVELKNRLVFAPTSMGLPLEEMLEKLAGIAKGGAALVIIGDVPVSPSPVHSLYNQKGKAYYRAITDCIHENGALAAAQLYQSDSNFKQLLPKLPKYLLGKLSADDLRKILADSVDSYITGLPTTKAKQIVENFGRAAAIAKELGFDIIQVHGDRMCGAFSSTVFNHRTDCFGGDVKSRAKFACDAVRAVRRAVPGMPIDYKLAVRQENPHYGNAGVLFEELGEFVPLLEEAGVDSFHVTLANHSALENTIPGSNHPYFQGEGCFLPYCDEVKRHTSLPVCGVGRLTSPGFVEQQLSEDRINLAGMSRQLIADPNWLHKATQGQESRIYHCTGCNRECLGGIKAHRGVHCIWDQKRREETDENSSSIHQ